VKQVYRKIIHTSGKNFLLISATVQKFQQCKYGGCTSPPVYFVQIALPARGLIISMTQILNQNSQNICSKEALGQLHDM